MPKLIDLQTTFLQVQARLNEYFGSGNVPGGIQEIVDQGEKQLTQSRQALRISECHGATLAAQFQGDPLLTSEEQTRLRSLVKDQKDRQSIHKGGRGGGARGSRGPGGVKGGKVNPPKKSTSGKAKSVSGSSQLIASSVSSGLATNVARLATSRAPVRSHKVLSVLTPPSSGISGCPPGPSGQG